MKKGLSFALCGCLVFAPAALLSGCGGEKETVLRVYNWEEYIDEGGEGSYVYDLLAEKGAPPSVSDAPSIIDDFERWYQAEYGIPVRVEYSTFGTNEDMYNQLKLGDTYDLVCPSDYMIMKLAAEDMLEPYSEDFFDTENRNAEYVKNVSPFIKEVFENGTLTVNGETRRWSDYAAGYMWGVTGFTYNPEFISSDSLQNWNAMTDPRYRGKVTTKDNVRDSYFVALAILYRDELLALDPTADDYNEKITEIMNRTDGETIQNVEKILLDMKENIYGFETDTGKADIIQGNIWLNFAWSGDAVYAMNVAEEEGVNLNFFVPEECANLWFDGWCMPKGANKQAAQAFVNFLSKPQNAIRNMYYIGYSSVIAGNEVLEYVQDSYGADEDADDAVSYDLSYFFGQDVSILTPSDQLNRQLYAQYPPLQVMNRCAVMNYYGDADAAINDLWAKVKGASLDTWAIVVISVGGVLAILLIVYLKVGAKIDLFRRKPKKGYRKISQQPLN